MSIFPRLKSEPVGNGKDSLDMDRRKFLAGLATSLPVTAYAEAPLTASVPFLRNAENIRRAAASSARLLDPAFTNFTGFALVDIQSGQLVDSYQPSIQLPPASVTKAITAVYARDTLGADYRFSTRLMATGPISGGQIQGDLYLVGGGDPLLDTDEIAGLAKTLVANGISGITGRFYVDNSALPMINEIDTDQPDYLGYNPAINGLNLNFNRVYFEWKRAESGYTVTMDARGEQHAPRVSWMGMSVANRDLPVFEHRIVNGHDQWTVAQTALGDGGGRWLPVRQPADYAGEVFETLAAQVGLRLPVHQLRQAPRDAVTLAQFTSEHLDEILRWLLKYSNNLTAECLGLRATQALGGSAQTLESSSNYMDRWAGVNLGGSNIGFRNHSGLTDDSRVSPLAMSTMLSSPRAQSHLMHILKPVVVTDRSGNAIDLGRSVIAKTGTLNFTRGLAGYIEKDARRYAFAIFAADLERRNSIPMAQRERPSGARTWSRKARAQEQNLLRHWWSTL